MLNLGALLVVLLAGAGGQDDDATLVEQLGSPRYAQREAAARTLEERGRRALPALREARGTRDPEIRARVGELIDRIESDLLVRPTMVRLDYRDRPLPEVVKDLSEQTGMTIGLFPENNPTWSARRITLNEDGPLSFWKAVDAVCRAGQLQPLPGMNVVGPNGGRAASLNLMTGFITAAPPVADSGPFRVQVLAINHDRHLTFGQQAPQNLAFGGIPQPGGAPAGLTPPDRNFQVSDNFFVNLQVLVEPRMNVRNRGPVRLDEAVDDKGQSLIPPAANAPQPRNSGYFGFAAGGGTMLTEAVQFRYPDEPGKAIRRLRGVVPVVVSSRKDEPTVVTLAEAKGKTVRAGDLTLTVNEIKADPNNPRQTQIDLTLRPNAAAAGANRGGGPMLMNDFGFQLPSPTGGQLEFLDEQGRVFPHWMPTSQQFGPEEARMVVMLTAQANMGIPVKLRLYDTTHAEAEVRFDFTDLPMP